MACGTTAFGLPASLKYVPLSESFVIEANVSSLSQPKLVTAGPS